MSVIESVCDIFTPTAKLSLIAQPTLWATDHSGQATLAIAPTVGYAIADKFMVGVNVSQADSSAEMVLDVHARYFYNGLFGYVSAPNLDTDMLSIGVGKMFTFHKGIYIDPKVVYDTNLKTTNLMLGFGLKF